MKGTVILLATVMAAVNFNPIIKPILEVLNAILWPAIAVVGSAGAIYCVFLGIKIAKSDKQNSREKAKKDLLGAVIGFALIFILIVALKIAMPTLQDWVRAQV
ncbi:hypothetical protein FACS1894211_14700 [Clostridia bacterium]|nr:hypothetical protein FACS1894211_14700 [Clostridia bacterium]